MVTPQHEVFTPSALNRLVHDLLEDALPLIWVEGELSNVARPTSGHIYFTLKDDAAQIRCALFKPKSTYLRFRPADGQHVLIRARVSLYETRGEYQLIAEHMEEAGEGALKREFERLKAKLAAEGLFDLEHKRPLPKLPRRIGVITSPTGAAIHDVLNVISRRFPLAAIEILPVPVQGKEAPPIIAAALRTASAANRYDVLLLTRGGGSLEDLQPFNDEIVAQAIYACTIPVVCAVGHEVDFTIADFVSDLRAPTPSAAAELLVPDAGELRRILMQLRERFLRCIHRQLEALAQGLDHVLSRLNAQRTQVRLARGQERLASLHLRLGLATQMGMERHHYRIDRGYTHLSACHPRLLLPRVAERVQLANHRLHTTIVRRLERLATRLAEIGRTLNAVSPLATLHRGYAILLEYESDRVVRSITQARSATTLRARLADGELKLRVED